MIISIKRKNKFENVWTTFFLISIKIVGYVFKLSFKEQNKNTEEFKID